MRQAQTAWGGYVAWMAMMNRRRGANLDRFAARRTREDGAPRLRDEVPTLVSLQLDVEDRAGASGSIKHLRRVMVDHAPALFLVPCGDPKCAGQEHDLTAEVLRALRSQETTFHGEDVCPGSRAPGGCSRVLRFEAVASYRPSSAASARVSDIRPRESQVSSAS